MPADFCLTPAILILGLVITTLHFARTGLHSERDAALWRKTAHQMQCAAALHLPFNDPLELKLSAMVEAAKVGIEPEARP